MWNVLRVLCEGTIVLLSCLIYRHNTKVEFGVFSGPLPVRPTDQGLLPRMGYCSGLQQSCFHPLQYYRRSYLIPNNQLIHCPWRRGHLCTGNFIPLPASPSLSRYSLSHFFFLLSLSVPQQWARTNSLCLFRSSVRSYITPLARIRWEDNSYNPPQTRCE